LPGVKWFGGVADAASQGTKPPNKGNEGHSSLQPAVFWPYTFTHLREE